MKQPKRLLGTGDPLTAKRSTTTVVPMKLIPYKGSKSTQDFFKNLEGDSRVDVSALKKVWNDNGQPDIRTFDTNSPSLTDRVYGKHRHYNPLTNTISLPTTKKFTVDDYSNEHSMSPKEKQSAADFANMRFAEFDKREGRYILSAHLKDELPHAQQFNGSFIQSTFKSLGNDIPDYIKGKSPYEDPNSLEYQAHSIIAPQIQNSYSKEKALNSSAALPINQMKKGVASLGKKKMALGGTYPGNFDYLKKIKGLQDPKFTGEAPTLPKPPISSNTIGAASDVLNAGVGLISPSDSYGVRSGAGAAASGALYGIKTGAMLGSSIPVVGTALGAGVGALVGGVTGILGNKKAKREKNIAIQKSTKAQVEADQARANAMVAANPELVYGNPDATLYRLGGTMKGTGVTPPRMKKPMAKIQGAQDLLPNVASVPGRQLSRRAAGGMIKPISSEDSKVEGPSHANGGVKLPEMGVELEGGETVNNGFVFSKQLGFAQKQEKIGKSLGKVEKMPDTVINRNTANALKRKTELLKTQQETVKSAMGIPNDLEQRAYGGMLGEGDKPGVPKKRVPAIVDKTAATYNPSLLTNGKFMVSKADGSTGQWGNDLYETPKLPVVSPGVPVIQPSDKAAGLSNTFYPSNMKPQGKDIPTQYPSHRFANGGQLPDDQGPKKKKDTSPMFGPWSMSQIGSALYSGAKKLANITQGRSDSNVRTALPVAPVASAPIAPAATSVRSIPTGRKPVGSSTAVTTAGRTRTSRPAVSGVTPQVGDKFPLPKVTDTGLPNLPELNVSDQPSVVDAVTRTVAATTNSVSVPSPPAQLGSNKRRSSMSSVVDGIDKITPFISNINNAATKLPLPPLPTLNDPVAASTVNYDSSRNEVRRSTASAAKAARANLNSGAAIAASAAAGIAQESRAVGQVNEAEQNTNTQIRNQNNLVNAQIKQGNNALKNNYQNELVERKIKGNELRSQNLANVEDKIQGMSRDKKLFDLEDQKVMLEALKDDTGAIFRGARSIFAKHLSDESLKDLDTHFTKLAADDAEDRKAARASGQLALNYIKRNKAAVEDEDKTLPQILGKLPTVTTAKEDDARNKSRRKK